VQFLKQLILELKRPLSLPVRAEVISPDVLSSTSVQEIGDLTVWEGNRTVKIEEIFNVKGETGAPPSEFCVVVSGDVEKIRHLGYRMSSGLLKIEGNAGMYLGEEMCGGRISIEGNAGSWLGSKMRGGTIEVYGDAGDNVGSSYRGSREGMNGGLMIIHGNAGVESGCWMGDGIIRIKRNAGIFPGIHMCGGVILIEGDCDGRAGAGMTGGRIIVCGKVDDVLPSFAIEEIRNMTKVGDEKIEGPFYVFQGDVVSEKIGRIFVSVTKNPHLNWCEKYLEPWQM
jgi:formylmethanofuran dehydrogenase subunit C